MYGLLYDSFIFFFLIWVMVPHMTVAVISGNIIFLCRDFQQALDRNCVVEDFIVAFALHDSEPKTLCLTVFVHLVSQKSLMGSRSSFTA